MLQSEIKKVIEENGFLFDGITCFKKVDRIRYSSVDIKYSLTLRFKIAKLTEKDLLTAIREKKEYES